MTELSHIKDDKIAPFSDKPFSKDLMAPIPKYTPLKWISVKDRLPREHGWYDVITFVKPSYKDDSIEKHERLYWNGKGVGRVTHWAEVAEPVVETYQVDDAVVPYHPDVSLPHDHVACEQAPAP